MKKALALILALLMVFSLVACGGSDAKTEETKKEETKKEETKVESTAQPGEDASKLEEVGTATAALSDTTSTLQKDHGITTEGKSKDLSIVVALGNDMAGTAPFAGGAGRNDTKYLQYDNLAVMHYPGGDYDEMDWVIAKNIVKVDNDNYEIEIYDYVKDWAGEHITAEDVKFSYEAYVASGASGKFTRLFGGMEVLDTYKVRLTLKNNALGVAQYMLQNCPIVSKKSYESQTAAELAQNAIGTGMYKIKEFVSGSHITFERVEDYWQTDSTKWPYLYSGQMKEIKLVIMTENSQRAIALENGSVDVVPVVAIEDVRNFMNDDGTFVDGYSVLKVLNSGVDYGLFNGNEASICSNLDMRLAISYAIDRAGVMDGTYGKGGYLPSNEVATAILGDYNKDWTWYEYDSAKAAEHLKAAGYKGEEIKIVCESTNYAKTKAELMQAYLSAAGINAVINAYDSALFSEYMKDPTMWDITLSTAGCSDLCVDAWNVAYTSSASKTFMNDEMTALLTAAGGLDTHSQDTVDAFHNYTYENCWSIPFGTYYKYSAAHDNMLLWAVHPFNYCTYGGFIFE